MTVEEITEIKERERRTWASGDYPSLARREFWPIGQRVIRRVGVSPGDDVLDVACGTGNAAIRAAQAGGRVVGVDITPELLEAGCELAEQAGVAVRWVEGDAEALPFEDASFDVVLSVLGCMFAPRHEVAARELARVLRPGGRMALCSWTPESSVGEFFRTVGSYLPPPPPFASPPTLWGSVEHVTALFEGTGVDVAFERGSVVVRYHSVADAMEYLETNAPPLVKARELTEADGCWPALREDLAAQFERRALREADGVADEREYLLTLGRKR